MFFAKVTRTTMLLKFQKEISQPTPNQSTGERSASASPLGMMAAGSSVGIRTRFVGGDAGDNTDLPTADQLRQMAHSLSLEMQRGQDSAAHTRAGGSVSDACKSKGSDGGRADSELEDIVGELRRALRTKVKRESSAVEDMTCVCVF